MNNFGHHSLKNNKSFVSNLNQVNSLIGISSNKTGYALEDFEINDLENSRDYYISTKLMAIYMRLSQLKIVTPNSFSKVKFNSVPSLEQKFPETYLKFKNPFRSYDKSKNLSLRDRIVPICVFLIYTYLTIKTVSLAILQTYSDFLTRSLNPKLKFNSTASEKCALKEDIYFEGIDVEINDRLEKISQLFQFIGNPCPHIGSAAILILSFAGLLSIVFFHFTFIVIQNGNFRFDSINILFNYAKERDRIQSELKRIVLEVIKSYQDYKSLISDANNYKLPFKSVYHSNINNDQFRINMSSSQNTNYNYLNGLNNNRARKRSKFSREVRRKFREVSYKNILYDFNLTSLVVPRNISSSWYKQLVLFDSFFMTSCVVFGFSTCLMFFFRTLRSEIYARIRRRLNQLECQKWNKNGVLIRDLLIQLPVFKTNQEILEYESILLNSDNNNNDNESLNVSISIFVTEAKYYFSNYKVAMSCFEILFLMLLFIFIGSFYYLSYTRTYSDRYVWLRQIRDQLKHCLELATQLAIPDDDSLELIECNNNNNNLDSNLLKALTITFLNYELFRRQHKNYLAVTNFLILQLSILLADVMLCTYYIGAICKDPEYNQLIILFSVYVGALVNGHIVSSAIMTGNLEQMMKDIMKLLAVCTSNSMHATHIVGLWRLQVMNERDTLDFYANKLLGVIISYKQVFSMNSYIIILWFILYRVAHSL